MTWRKWFRQSPRGTQTFTFSRAVLDVLAEPDEGMLRAVDDEDEDPMVARGRAYSAWVSMLQAARSPAKED